MLLFRAASLGISLRRDDTREINSLSLYFTQSLTQHGHMLTTTAFFLTSFKALVLSDLLACGRLMRLSGYCGAVRHVLRQSGVAYKTYERK